MIGVWNVNPPRATKQIASHTQDMIDNTLNLRQVSLEDAAREFGW